MTRHSGQPSAEGASDSTQLGKYPLSSIRGLHPILEVLYAELSIPPLRQVPRRALRASDIENLLESFPLRVCNDRRHRLRCTGNVRLYRLAQALLSGQVQVPCIEEQSPTPERLTRRALWELLYGSACLGAHFSDVRVLAAVARRAVTAGRLSGIDRPLEAVLCDLYGVDRRQIQPKPVSTEAAPDHRLAGDANAPAVPGVEHRVPARAGPLSTDVLVAAEEPIVDDHPGEPGRSPLPNDRSPERG